jgi:5'-nucleotidase
VIVVEISNATHDGGHAMRRTRRTPPAPTLLAVMAAVAAVIAAPVRAQQPFSGRVLITNDNGIDDPKIVALARAFARQAEVWVVAPAADRSGSGNYLTVTRAGKLTVEPRDLGPGIRAFAVHGYPADCVVLALLGVMRNAPPDLVVSGINGGANLGIDWLFSGTIGAARVAALAGIPAMAVSGLDDDIPGAVDAAVEWVVRLAGHELMDDLGPAGYLTVSMPRLAPDQIRGVRLADRAPIRTMPRIEAAGGGVWRVTGEQDPGTPAPSDSDQALWDEGFIAVIPMRADEVDHARLLQRRRQGESVAWP